MSFRQTVYDRVRVLNKRFTNRILIRIAGKRFGHFVILHHTGRRTGREYAIPVIAEPAEEGFVIALTYGLKVDWWRNVEAKGGCRIRWKEREYPLTKPTLIPQEDGLRAFPPLLRPALRMARVEYFLRLEKV